MLDTFITLYVYVLDFYYLSTWMAVGLRRGLFRRHTESCVLVTYLDSTKYVHESHNHRLSLLAVFEYVLI